MHVEHEITKHCQQISTSLSGAYPSAAPLLLVLVKVNPSAEFSPDIVKRVKKLGEKM